jgi:hypothetical protein
MRERGRKKNGIKGDSHLGLVSPTRKRHDSKARSGEPNTGMVDASISLYECVASDADID